MNTVLFSTATIRSSDFCDPGILGGTAEGNEKELSLSSISATVVLVLGMNNPMHVNFQSR